MAVAAASGHDRAQRVGRRAKHHRLAPAPLLQLEAISKHHTLAHWHQSGGCCWPDVLLGIGRLFGLRLVSPIRSTHLTPLFLLISSHRRFNMDQQPEHHNHSHLSVTFEDDYLGQWSATSPNHRASVSGDEKIYLNQTKGNPKSNPLFLSARRRRIQLD